LRSSASIGAAHFSLLARFNGWPGLTGQGRDMTEPEPRASSAPIWIGLVLGAAIGVVEGGIKLIISVPLGFALGYAFYVRSLAVRDRAVLMRRFDAALERIGLLELTVQRMGGAPAKPESAPVPVAPAEAAEDVPSLDFAFPEPAQPTPAMEPVASSAPPPQREAAVPYGSPAATIPPRTASGPTAFERAIGAAKAWLLGGNTVARVGLLVLFVGVAFLLRYLAEHARIPVELRLAGVALLGVVLLVFGWRMRERQPGYAITLQGGAVGILYLTVFAALRLYDVLQPLPAFALLAALAVLSGALSILQNARALAALGATGGFLAPLLVSTGAGRIELLLSYYLLLNLGVLGIAWFRSWRELNWIAFAFTFAVMGLWVVERYTPASYTMAQGFLIAFWLLFLVVALLYALRQPASTRGIFDTTLTFALPLAAFGIQSRLTEGVQLALAATVAAAAYLASSALLLRRREAALQVLTEANFGVGVALLTLAVPLAASAQWTAAAWALEGVALLWVALRQKRVLPLAAGLILHALGALALLRAYENGEISLAPEFSGATLNLLVLAATAFISAWLMWRAVGERDQWGTARAWLIEAVPWGLTALGWAWVVALLWQPLAHPWYVFAWCALALGLMTWARRTIGITAEWSVGVAVILVAWLASEARAGLDERLLVFANVATLTRLAVAATALTAALLSLGYDQRRRVAAAGLLTVGVLTWLIAVLAETAARIDSRLAVAQLALAVIIATALALTWLGQRLRWDWPLRLSWLQFAAHAVLAATVIALALGAAVLPSRHYGALLWPVAWAAYYARLAWEARLNERMPAPAVVHVAGVWLLAAMLAAEIALRLDAIAGDGWFHAAWGAVPALALWIVVQHALRWPMRTQPHAYATMAAPGLALYALMWIVVTSVITAGDPAPLPYVPLANPLDIASLLTLVALLRWHAADQRAAWQQPVRWSVGAAAFVALNAAALRAVHAIAGVPWDSDALARSLVVQSVLSLLWTSTALALMVFGHRRGMRALWLVGAALLGAVVAKLFFVDLSGQGTIERIVSFVGVGLLILLIGYLAPVPPASESPARSAA
jgi:uncharacterized membrane protein